RSYSVDSTLAEIPRLAAAHGLNVVLGAWISNDPQANEVQINKLIKVLLNNIQADERQRILNQQLLFLQLWQEVVLHLLSILFSRLNGLKLSQL
ncbi:MAG: hypothetical protein EOM68_23555, partial [Spirochaetia bacterium]|nr:hypothetical protein [Spirochaetia bacterium]